MNSKSIFYILCFLTIFSSCREELNFIEDDYLENITNDENNTFSSKRITLKQLKQEIVNWNDIQESTDLLYEKGLLPFSIDDNITYRKITNQNNITYTLPIHFYTNDNPYHLIQQIIINDQQQQTIQYLKIFPKNTAENIQQDIFKTPNDIEILDHKLNNINPTTSKIERLKKQNSDLDNNKIRELSRSCRVYISVSEVLCSNGGRHGVGESCQPGYENDAHYRLVYIEHCSAEVFTGLESDGMPNSSVGGGVYVDYLVNRLISNPNFVYTRFITHPKQKLLLNAIRKWSINNKLDNPNNIKILNSKIKYFAENPSIFDDIETYDKRTPYVANKELESYSTRIAEMFDYFLDNTSAENAKAMKYSVKYLDQNRFISWQDYLPIFRGIGKLASLYPDNYWRDIEKALDLENIIEPKKLEKIIEDWINPNTVKPTAAFMRHEKLYRIYNQAKGTDNFKRFLQKFEPKAPVAHLMFDLGETKNDLAQTSSPNNYWIKIIFNKNIDWNNRPEIIIAYTFIHEILHAEMYRQLLAVANTNGSISYEKLKKYAKNNKKELFNEYLKQTPNYQHQIMAKRYIDTVIDFMKELYGNEYTEKEYLTIAWMGVYETDAWNKLSNTQKEEYETIWKENYNKWKK